MKTIKKSVACLAAAVLVLALAASNANAATGTESFTVTVASELTIAPPAASATITHDKTDTNQVFPAQTWSVTQNGSAGASVTFKNDVPFTNGTTKRDLKLDLAIASSEATGGWTVTTATDQTDYANATTPKNVATVAADATGPGNASFNLTVTFLDTNYSVLPSGNFAMTITGTITSK